jgi:archaemetzincin
LLPIGTFDSERANDVEWLRAFTAAFFMMEAQWLPELPVDPAKMPFKEGPIGRRQLYTQDALEVLVDVTPRDAFCLLAVTLEDLVPRGNWNYVFGQASLRDRVGIFSFARFDPAFFGRAADDETPRLISRRRCSVLAHEIGHMFGMQHCIYYHCLMNGSNSLPESDAAPLHLCPVCLRKLHASIGFDLREREERLARLLAERQLAADAAWYQSRVSRSAE